MAQLVENLIFKDVASNSSITNTGTNVTISSANNINFNCFGSINFNKDIDCSTNTFENVVNINGQTNSDIVLSTQSGQSLNLRTNGTTNKLTIQSDGSITFNNVANCSVLPSLNTEFINFNTFTNIQSFSPSIQLSTGSLTVSYNERRGRYVRFGNLIYFTCYVKTNTLSGTDSGADLRCTLPVNLPNGGFICPLVVGYYDNLNTITNVATICAQIDDDATSYFTFYKKVNGGSNGNIELNLGNTTNTFLFVVSGSYYLF
jgi:hypothetical protein